MQEIYIEMTKILRNISSNENLKMMTNEQLQHYISLYQEQLLEKGYMGSVHASGELHGSMPGILSNAFKQAIIEQGDVPDKKDIVFHIIEYPYGKKEAMDFQFEYCYDPEAGAISAKQLVVRYEGVPGMTLLFTGSFPCSKDIYDFINRRKILFKHIGILCRKQKDRRLSFKNI